MAQVCLYHGALAQHFLRWTLGDLGTVMDHDCAICKISEESDPMINHA